MSGLGEMNWENGIKMWADLNFDFPVEENALKALSVKVNAVIVNLRAYRFTLESIIYLFYDINLIGEYNT